jgi:hypothetical protein
MITFTHSTQKFTLETLNQENQQMLNHPRYKAVVS